LLNEPITYSNTTKPECIFNVLTPYATYAAWYEMYFKIGKDEDGKRLLQLFSLKGPTLFASLSGAKPSVSF